MKRLVLLSCIAVAIARSDESEVGLRGRVRQRESPKSEIQHVESPQFIEVSSILKTAALPRTLNDQGVRTLKHDKQSRQQLYKLARDSSSVPEKSYEPPYNHQKHDAISQKTVSQQDIEKVPVFDPIYGVPIYYTTPTKEDENLQTADESQLSEYPSEFPSSVPTSTSTQDAFSLPEQAHVYETPRYHGYITMSPTSSPSSMPVPMRLPAQAWPKFEIGNSVKHISTPSPSVTRRPQTAKPTIIPALPLTSPTTAKSPVSIPEVDITSDEPSATPTEDPLKPIETPEISEEKSEELSMENGVYGESSPSTPTDALAASSPAINSTVTLKNTTKVSTNTTSMQKNTTKAQTNTTSMQKTLFADSMVAKQSTTTNSSVMEQREQFADLFAPKESNATSNSSLATAPTSMPTVNLIDLLKPPKKIVEVTRSPSYDKAPAMSPTQRLAGSPTKAPMVELSTAPRSETTIQSTSKTNATVGQDSSSLSTDLSKKNATTQEQSSTDTDLSGKNSTTSKGSSSPFIEKNATTQDPSPMANDSSRKNATTQDPLSLLTNSTKQNSTTSKNPSSPFIEKNVTDEDPSSLLTDSSRKNLTNTQQPSSLLNDTSSLVLNSTTSDPTPLITNTSSLNSTTPKTSPVIPAQNASSKDDTGTKWVSSNVLNFQTVGATDLDTVEKTFYNRTLSLMKPYVGSRLAPILIEFELIITFLEKKVSTTMGTDKDMTAYASVFEVLAGFSLKGDEEQIGSFKDAQANALVRDFFQGGMLERLLLVLQKDDIHVRDIREVSLSNKGPQIPPDSGDFSSSIGEAQKIGGGDAKSTVSNQTVLYATLVTAIVIALSLVAIVLIKRRRQRRFYVYRDPVVGGGASVSSYGDGESRIKPAAIQKRKQRAMSDSVESYDASVVLAPVMEGEEGDIHDVFTFYESSRKMQSDSISKEGQLISLEMADDRKEVPGAILKCLDGEISLNGLNRQYPEFEAFVNIQPPSPYWSVEGLSYYGDGDEYQEQRRRWQDEANDVALIALPNLDSDSTNSSTSNDEESQGGFQNLPELQ